MLRMMVVHQWTIPCKAAVNLDFVTASLSCILLGILSLDRTILEYKVNTFKVYNGDCDSYEGQQSVFTVKRMGFLIFIK